MALHHGIMDHDNISSGLKNMRFEVTGAVYNAAMQRLKEGKEVIFTNVGNPHALGQNPITFLRQVMALVTAPFLMDDPAIIAKFPQDAIERAQKYLSMVKGGVGAYSDSRGNPGVIQEICDFLERRDGFAGNPSNIFLTNGASEGVRNCLRALLTCNGGKRGVLTPIPQYPLYTAAIALYDGQACGYYLDEEQGWALSIPELERAHKEATCRGVEVCAMVFISPGNPTGQLLSVNNLREVIMFCVKHKLVLFSDEVYQENVYIDQPFVSARKVLHEMGEPYCSSLEMVNFHTASKGAWGECGYRGGYFELMNIDKQTNAEMYKLASVNLSPNVPGQIAMGIMVNPPAPGDESYPLFKQEKDARLASLARRAQLITDGFNACEGVVCQPVTGSMYSFPRLCLPLAAQEEAKRRGLCPDVMYCLDLLEATGVSTTPGSAFEQVPGTYHLRTTILPPEDTVETMMQSIQAFHARWMDKYRGTSVGAKL